MLADRSRSRSAGSLGGRAAARPHRSLVPRSLQRPNAACAAALAPALAAPRFGCIGRSFLALCRSLGGRYAAQDLLSRSFLARAAAPNAAAATAPTPACPVDKFSLC